MRTLIRIMTVLAMLFIFPTLSFAATSLHDKAPGSVITFSGKQWVILEQMPNGTTYIILNDNDGNRAFDPDQTQLFNPNDSNNIGYYLNNDFYNSLTQRDLIENHSWDIKYQDGSGSQANVTAKISLISYSEYQKYSTKYNGNILPDSYSYYWWTRTPYSGHSSHVYNVFSNGDLNIGFASLSRGVRPALYLRSGLLVSDTNEVLSGGTLLPKPTGLIVSTRSHDFVQLIWNEYENATEYIVYRNSTEIARVSSNQYTDSNVQGNTQYSYTIKAVVNGESSGTSESVEVKTLLSPVINFMAMATSYDEIQLSWTKSTDTGLAGYIIYRNDTEIARVSPTQTVYIDENLTPATIYNYSIQSYTATDEKSIISPIKTAVTDAYPKPEITYKIEENMITLSWTGTAENYIVKIEGVGTETTGNTFSFVTEPGTTYQIQVIAVLGGNQYPSDIIEASTTTRAPYGLQANVINGMKIELSWVAIDYPNLAGYVIFRNDIEIDRVDKDQTIYIDKKTSQGESYSYYIKSYDTFNNLSFDQSNTVTINTPLGAPTNVNAKAESINSILLTWDAITSTELQGYAISRDGEEIARVDRTVNSYLDDNLTPGTDYSYFVQSIDKNGNLSEPSQSISVNTLSLNKPELEVTKNGTSIVLTWTGEADYYIINVNGEEIGTTTEKTYTYNGEMGKAYEFEVVAVIDGYLAPSNKVKLRLTHTILPDGAVGDVITSAGTVVAPIGGLLALGLALKASPMLIVIAKGIFLRL